MRGYLLCSLALGVVSCNVDGEFAEAIPTSDQVSIKVPQSGGGSSTKSEDGLGAQASALVGHTSELYQLTYGVSASVNAGTVILLGALRLVTLQTPTSRTTDSRTWGPYTPGGLDPMSYRLIVTKLGEQHFGFSLDAAARLAADPSAFAAIVDGELTKGTKLGTGKGTMTLHFDNRRKLVADACEDGTLAFDFDTTVTPARNDVTLHEFANSNASNILCGKDKPTEAAYHFEQDASGAGNFVFSVATDIVIPQGQTTPSDEQVLIRSRWLASGAGRSDIRIAGADVTTALGAVGLSDGPVSGSQCWDTRFATAYQTSTPVELVLFGDAGGQASLCVFASADLPQ